MADNIVRYAAHLLLKAPSPPCARGDGTKASDGAPGPQTDDWATARDHVRIEAVDYARDATNERKILYQPEAGTWRFADTAGRRFHMEMRVNREKPVGCESDPRLYWEATIAFCGTRDHVGGDAARDPSERAHDALAQYVRDAYAHAEPQVKDRITVRRWTSTHWSRLALHAKRPMDTVFLPNNTLEEIDADLKEFLTSEEDYARFGRPYKRVYLLSGAPGLGKSSLALALAGRHNMDLYVYPVDRDASDQTLASAASGMETPCLMLIEDIDAAGKAQASQLTLSGLTNVLDGAQTRSGMIVFLTTNHPELLDPTLTRSGRVDRWVRFDAVDADQIAAMVKHYFAPQFGLPSSGGAPAAGHTGARSDKDMDSAVTVTPEQEALFKKRVKALDAVAQSLSLRRVSGAALSEFVFVRRRSPDIMAELQAQWKTIGRRNGGSSLGPSPTSSSSCSSSSIQLAPGGVDGQYDRVDTSTLYC